MPFVPSPIHVAEPDSLLRVKGHYAVAVIAPVFSQIIREEAVLSLEELDRSGWFIRQVDFGVREPPVTDAASNKAEFFRSVK